MSVPMIRVNNYVITRPTHLIVFLLIQRAQ